MTKRAVVIGGSIAGLLAARALSDHFESVTIVDRDHPPAAPEPRKGVPQGKHGHGLLAAGSNVMDELFPGMFEEMVAGGAVAADAGEDIWWFNSGAWRIRTRCGIIGYLQSRPFLEFHIRKRVAQLPGVQEVCGYAATGLSFASDGQRVSGVQLRAGAGEAQTLSADLVVDCSGRGSQLPAWLEAAGWPRPPVSRVEVNVGYSSRILRLPNGQPEWKALLMFGQPPKQSRLGVMLPVEGGQWMMTLGGEFRDYPPEDEAGFADFARSLYHPVLYERLCAAEPVTPIVTYRFPAHVWNHFERLERWPEGLLVLGDGVCSFNPIYGQGMTVAALEAKVLQRCLGRQQNIGGNGQALARDYYRGISAPVAAAWAMATGADLAYPQTQGPRTRAGAWVGRYLDHVIAMTCYDPCVLKQWVLVTHMVKPISAVFHPRIVARVLRRVIAGGPPLPTDQPRRI